jgi:hypothetical protein
MVNGVTGHAEDEFEPLRLGDGRSSTFFDESRDGAGKPRVLALNKIQDGFPRKSGRVRQAEPIVSLEDEWFGFLARELRAGIAYNIRMMQRDFRDAVTPGCRAPERHLGGHVRQRRFQIWSMPRTRAVPFREDPRLQRRN